ncbi:MAG TPA: PKD domain-containing protein [Phnomibacter sp.]|nr:PKD domain-containing protein [Phnomibacter sp.]
MAGFLFNGRPMRRLLTMVCLLHASFFAIAQVGDQQLTKIASWNAYVHMPDDYDANPTKKYPVIVFIPGLGEIGTDASKLLVYGPGYYIKQGNKMQFTVNGVVEKPIVISLQPASSWPNPDVINTRIDSIMKRWRIDPNRLYLTGLSMGGFSADNYITGNANYAKKVAAIVAMSAVEPNFPLTNLRPYALNGGKWWGFEGTTDYRKMDLIRDTMNRIVPGSARYTQYVGGHCCWNTWYNPTWTENGENIYEWMLKQSLGASAPVNQPPVANAGPDMTIEEGTVININSNGSTDPDGTIASKKWTITNTATGGVVQNEATTLPSTLPVGTYRVVLKVTDNMGATATDEMILTVKQMTPANNAPKAAAGNDKLIHLPTASVVLDGSGSSDTDGTISSGSWTQISGPSAAQLSNANTLQCTASGLEAGIYKFQLTVTDNGGATGKDTLQITVNQPPVVNAGIDRVFAIGGTISISATVSDPDGSIASQSWTISNSQTGEILYAGVAAFPSTLPKGSYKAVLTATDNRGASASDEMLLVVNEKPVAIAGLDLSIKAPVSDFTFSSNRSYDVNGTIVGYTWTRLSGPATIDIKNQHTATPTFTTLEVGMHVFQLVVTDDYGLTGADTVRINVTSTQAGGGSGSGGEAPVVENVRNRILIDAGPTPSVGKTTEKDQWGKYWNNVTDGRAGVRLTNAVDTANRPTTLGVEVITRIDGTFSTSGNGMNGGNTIGDVGDYPSSATDDNAFGHNSTTAGTWRIYGLDPKLTYNFKFWGTRSSTGTRTLQIKKSTDADYTQESDAVNNKNYNQAMYFNGITGVTEVVFNMRVKPGQTYGNISVIDIVTYTNPAQPVQANILSVKPAATTATAAPTVAPALDSKIDAQSKNTVQIWPNPTTGNSHLQLVNTYRGQTNITVLNNAGATIRTITISKTQDVLTHPINLSGIAKGIYYVKVQMGTISEMKKLVLQ